MLIDEYKDRLSVNRMCQLLGVSRGSYYHFRGLPVAVSKDNQLLFEIRGIRSRFKSYGYRRMTAALRRKGIVANHKRVLRIMRENALLARKKRRYVATTDSVPVIYPNRARSLAPTHVDQLWVADITFGTPEGRTFQTKLLQV